MCHLTPNNHANKHTITGTDIEAVKQKNADSGMSYNEAKEYIARTTGGHNTDFLSNTNFEAVRAKNQQSERQRS